MKKVSAIIVAGGKGLRMNMDVRKQYLELDGLPILSRTLRVFQKCTAISDICLVIPRDDHDYCVKHILAPLKSTKQISVVFGGDERQKSVYNGLESLLTSIGSDDLVAIHDGVRPFVTEKNIIDCVDAAATCGAAIMALPVTDTLKMIDDSGMIEKTLDRNRIWAAQTPQVFTFGLIWEAHQISLKKNTVATDDASLVEMLGTKVRLVEGSKNNLKITTKEDILLAKNLMKVTK